MHYPRITDADESGSRDGDGGVQTLLFALACLVAAAALYLSYIGVIASSPFVE